MKTLEFKVQLVEEQLRTMDTWLDELRWIWNKGLQLLFEYHQRKYYDWLAKNVQKRGVSLDGIVLCQLWFPKHSAWSLPFGVPLPEKMKTLLGEWQKDQGYKFFGLGGARCEIAKIVDGKWERIEPKLIPDQPRLKGVNYFSLSGYLTKRRCNNIRKKEDLPPLNVVTAYIQGILNQLAESWAAYIDSKRKNAHRPKFKKPDKPIKSLFCIQPQSLSLHEGYAKLPGLGKVRIVGSSWEKRIEPDWILRTATIKQRASGNYLCLTFANPLEMELSDLKKQFKAKELKEQPELRAKIKADIERLETAIAIKYRIDNNIKLTDRIVGIDPGLINIVTTDQPKREVKAPRLYRGQEKKLQRLQRKASRQQQKSNSRKRTQKKINRLKEKIRRARNSFNHKLSTKLIREYSAIVVEDLQIQNLNHRPKPKPRENGRGYAHNGAKRKSGINKSFADSALGDLLIKLETKAMAAGLDFIKVPAHYTTVDCSSCGAKVAKALSTRTHECPSCNYVDTRDGNAAKNILTKGRQLLLECFGKTYRAWAWEGGESLKRDESVLSPTSGTSSGNTTETLSLGMPPEAVREAALQPRDEHSLQQPNSSSKDLPKTHSSPCTLNVSVHEQLLLIHDLDTESNPRVAGASSNKKKTKSRTSGAKKTEGFVQLSFLDGAGVIQVEDLGAL
jgi:putative transposase